MGWFRKREKAEGEATKQLVFKDSESAFQYACMYLDTSLADENSVLGVVLHAGDDDYAIKLSNPDDPTIPSDSLDELMAVGHIKNISQNAPVADRVPPLVRGNLVMCISPNEIAKLGIGYLGAVIVDKVDPIYDVEKGWRISQDN